ncbi:MAG: HEAT repeat domain-containing protein [bacterium]
MELVISKRLYLLFSGLLVLLVCMLFSCGQQGKGYRAKSNELQVESKEQKVEAKEQAKIQPKKETNQTKPELSKKEKKRIEKRILEIVERIERCCDFRPEEFASEEKMEEAQKHYPTQEELDKMVKEMRDMGHQAVPTLIKVLKDKKRLWKFREFVINLMITEEIKDERMIKPLMEIVKDRRDDIVVRLEVARVLEDEFGKKGVLKLEGEQKKMRKKVLKIVDRMEKVWAGKGDSWGKAIFTYGGRTDLEHIGKPGVPTMIEVIKDKKRNRALRVDLAEIIIYGIYGSSRVDPEGMVVYGTKDNEAVKPLLEVVGDEEDDGVVRGQIVHDLGKSESVRPEPLVKLLETTKNVEVRSNIINAVGYVGNKETIKVLIKILEDKNENMRCRACAAGSLSQLGERTGDRSMVEPLIKMFDEKGVGSYAIGIIGALGDARAVEPLIKIGAAEALGNLWEHGVHDEKIVDALIEKLKDEDGLVVRRAAKALGKTGSKRAIEPLIEAFKNETDFGTRRFIAVFGLSKFKDERVIKLLEEALKEPKNECIKEELMRCLKNVTTQQENDDD